MMSPEIIDSAFQYLQEVLDRNLPKDRCFHNLKHTKSVIKGAYELSNAMGVSKEEQQELILAAIFHDIGHVRTYMLHEEESKSIAHDFLSFKKYPEDKIEQVLKIIDATKMPQKPSTKLQM
ncbi:MAG: HD domain-containing protein, partial [Flavobacteriales bacterium]|nr:HD domain-containing protein [Flavobacteriales bacterium]